MDVGAIRNAPHTFLPIGKSLRALPGIGADTQWSAEMVEYDARVRKGSRQIDKVPELGLEHPRVEAQTERAKRRKSLPKSWFQEQPGCAGIDRKARVGVPGRTIADPAQTSFGNSDMLLDHVFGAGADFQIHIADNASAAACWPVLAGGAHPGDICSEFGFTERAQFLRAFGAIHRATFLEQRRANVMTADDVTKKILQEIAIAWPVPQMMMRIDDWQVGVDDVFVMFIEPVLPDRCLDRGSGGPAASAYAWDAGCDAASGEYPGTSREQSSP